MKRTLALNLLVCTLLILPAAASAKDWMDPVLPADADDYKEAYLADLQGTWLVLKIGCNLQLTAEQIQALPVPDDVVVGSVTESIASFYPKNRSQCPSNRNGCELVMHFLPGLEQDRPDRYIIKPISYGGVEKGIEYLVVPSYSEFKIRKKSAASAGSGDIVIHYRLNGAQKCNDGQGDLYNTAYMIRVPTS